MKIVATNVVPKSVREGAKKSLLLVEVESFSPNLGAKGGWGLSGLHTVSRI